MRVAGLRGRRAGDWPVLTFSLRFTLSMAYDEGLAQRVREQLGGEPGLTERAMFGGLAFLLDGNMSVALRARS
jgi:hypothetical protein